MNTLKTIDVAAAIKQIKSGKSIADGTLIIADHGTIESGRINDDLTSLERHVGTDNWQRSWGDGVYHYTLLVARQGIQEILDSNGEVCGAQIVGTNRQY